MKKLSLKNVPWLRYALLLLVGIFIGWLFFNDGNREANETHAHQEGEETIWTCSMHPQIRQNEPGQCPICGMDLIPASGGKAGGGDNRYVNTMTAEAVAMSNIQTSEVKRTSAQNEISLTGKIQINEQKISTIAASFPGRIEKLYINFTGEEVKKGQRMATIYSPELVTAQKELLEAAKIKQSNPALYNAAKEKLRLWKLSSNQIGSIEQRGEVLLNFDVYAFTSGIVINRMVSEGDYVDKGNSLFEVVDLSSVWVVLDAYESDLGWITKGDDITIKVAALPGEEITTKITYIDPRINPVTRAASVRAEVPNKEGKLKPEMFVNAVIKGDAPIQEKGIAIPKTALLWTGKRSVVYVKVPKSEKPAFEMREITLGSRMGDFYLIEGGLEAGEEIVTHGVFAVDAAAQLSGNYSMMARPEVNDLQVPDAFTSQLTKVVESYFDLKNALVESDPDEASTHALNMEKELESVDMSLLKEKAHDHWMRLLNPLQVNLSKIHETDQIDGQRQYFQDLSDTILEAVEIFGIQNDKVFKAYCPMASNDEGAYWLSEFEEIRNPYFGEAMLTCGEVKEVIRKGSQGKKSSTDKPVSAQSHRH